MARKKEVRTGFHLKYIPAGRLNDLVELANNFPFIKDKNIALTKYVEILSAIIEKHNFYKSKKESSKKYVAVSQRMLIKQLGFDSAVISKILKDLVENKFLEKSTEDFQIGVVSWKYRPILKNVETIIFKRSCLNKKTDLMLSTESVKISDFSKFTNSDLLIYSDSVTRLKLDNSIFDFINNEYQNIAIKEIESKYKLNNNINKNNELEILYNTINFISTIYHYVNCTGFVPNENEQLQCTGFVPSETAYKSLGIIRSEFIPIIKVLSGNFKVSRPIKNSRVYSNITNLKRCFRPFLRLNGKPLIGFDIANSQPLLACIEFNKFSMEKYGYIKPDVAEYQRICEAGKFYEYFTSLPELQEIDIVNDEDLRSDFKGTFFGKIFYSKNIEQENFLKNKFKEKYPTCYEAIFKLKGDKNYSIEYKKFSALMTERETEIMWNTNLEVIEQGYDMVNIFDSLYSDDELAIALAKHLVIEKFQIFGITPTLKDIDYRTESKPIEIVVNPVLASTQIIKPIKQSAMKKEPLNTKQNQKVIPMYKLDPKSFDEEYRDFQIKNYDVTNPGQNLKNEFIEYLMKRDLNTEKIQ